MNRFIVINDEGVVVSVRYGSEVVEGELKSEVGEVGQIIQEDGTFVDVSVDPIEPTPTVEEQILYENKYQTMLLEMSAFN